MNDFQIYLICNNLYISKEFLQSIKGKKKRAGVLFSVEQLPSKGEALSSNPSTIRRERRKERRKEKEIKRKNI
jgi:hypothetical protein